MDLGCGQLQRGSEGQAGSEPNDQHPREQPDVAVGGTLPAAVCEPPATPARRRCRRQRHQ